MSDPKPSSTPPPGAPTSQPSPPQRTFTPDFLLEMFANPLDAGYADAARRRERVGPPGPANRRTGFIVRTIVLIATGLLLAIAYQQTIAAAPATSDARKGLVTDIQARQADTDAMQRQADALRQQVSSLRDAQIGTSGAQALRDLEARTGLAAVRGDGVVVTMADGPVPVDPVTGKATGENLGRVLDADLQNVVNELWHDGAEAISINGKRLTVTSTIRAAGSAILVDFQPINQPYKISAIGPPSLEDGLRASPTGQLYARLTQTYGMHFTIAQADNLSLPAAADPQLRYATTVKPPAPPSPSPSSTGGR